MKRTPVENFIHNHLRNIAWACSLDDFEVSFSCLKPKKGEVLNSVSMQIRVDYEYLQGKISVNKNIVDGYWKKKNYSAIVADLCHEMAHLITSEPFDELGIPYKGRSKILQERLTERVSRLMCRVYNKWMRVFDYNMATGEEHTKKKK